MFARKITPKLTQALQQFYAVALVGPRQSGKTTLLTTLLPDYSYLNMEDPDTRFAVSADPRGFFSDQKQKWIIDEAQEYPELFSYLLGFIDTNKMKGQFVLSGSKNFMLIEKITQSLAGRIALLELLPLSYSEFETNSHMKTQDVWQTLFQGSYPGLLSENIDPYMWYKSYLTTYLERDVRQLINIRDLGKFHMFLKLCAGRHGQLINLSDIGTACGISHTTVNEWITLLEASFILFRLPPYYKNFDKRIVKTHKLYFYDSGLVCHLLNIESANHLKLHASRGAIFEGYILSEILKEFTVQAKQAPVYFWKNYKGIEVDILIETSAGLKAVEVKAGATITKDFFRQLQSWQAQTSQESYQAIVYAGDENLTIKNTEIIPWYKAGRTLTS